MMYDELIKRLRDMATSDGNIKSNYIGLTLLQAADAIEELTRESEKYKSAWREEHKKRIDENKYLYDELTKAVREKLLMTPMRIEVPKWIPVTERLPEDGTEVLAFNKTGFAYVDCWTDGKWKINSMVDEEHESVTHWMPLPQPPESEET